MEQILSTIGTQKNNLEKALQHKWMECCMESHDRGALEVTEVGYQVCNWEVCTWQEYEAMAVLNGQPLPLLSPRTGR